MTTPTITRYAVARARRGDRTIYQVVECHGGRFTSTVAEYDTNDAARTDRDERNSALAADRGSK